MLFVGYVDEATEFPAVYTAADVCIRASEKVWDEETCTGWAEVSVQVALSGGDRIYLANLLFVETWLANLHTKNAKPE